MANVKKPNTICRNPNCTHGEDGGRKKFYACLACMRRESWRAYCCSIECYEEYTKLILDSRSKGNTEPIQPERIDMSSEDINKVMEAPMEAVEEYTKNVEIKDYISENPAASFSEIIEKINEDIDSNSQVKTKNATADESHKTKKSR